MSRKFDLDLNNVVIQRARDDELQDVLKLWVEAANWLESLGIYQWEPNSFTIESVNEHYENTELFVARSGESIIGTFP